MRAVRRRCVVGASRVVACVRRRQRPASASPVQTSYVVHDQAGRVAAARARGHPLLDPDLRPEDAAADRERRRAALRRQADRQQTPNGPQSKTWDGLTYGPEVGTYHAKLNFVVAGHLGGGDSVSARLASPARAHRLDAGRHQRTAPSTQTPLMRHFYRSHMSPADVLAAADDFFPKIGLAQNTTAPQTRTYSGPLGALKLSVQGRRRALHVRPGRHRSDGREPSRPQRQEILRCTPPHRGPGARADVELLTALPRPAFRWRIRRASRPPRSERPRRVPHILVSDVLRPSAASPAAAWSPF